MESEPRYRSVHIDCGEIDPSRSEPGTYQTAVRLPGELLNIGTYTFRASIETAGILEPLDHQDGLTFELHDPDGSTARNSWGRPRQGVLFLDLPWTTERCSGRAEPALSEAEGCRPIRAATVRERTTKPGGPEARRVAPVTCAPGCNTAGTRFKSERDDTGGG